MTLISSIIQDAFREGNILPLGRDPNENQQAEALRLFNGIFSAIYGNEAGEPLVDWPLGNFGREASDSVADFHSEHPPINRRLIATNEEPRTIYLTSYPQDGSRMGVADPYGRLGTVPITLDANGRTIEGAPSITVGTDGTFAQWFYRADLGDWVRLTSKAVSDELPFPEEFDNFFTVLLALRLNPRYGREMDGQSAMIFKSQRRNFVARYLQSQPLEANDDLSWPFMTTQGRASSSARNFNRGGYGGP